jgi:hypothetical protein
MTSPVSGKDSIFPDDGTVQSDYVLFLSPGISTDTVTITRNIINYNAIGVDSVVVLVNLPRMTELLDYYYDVSAANPLVSRQGPLENHIVPNSMAYLWIIKTDGGSPGSVIEPLDHLKFTYRFLMPKTTGLELAPHAAIAHFPDKAIYTVSDSIIVDQGDYHEIQEVDNIPARLSFSASPNPFNGSVRLKYTGDGIKGQRLDFRIFDILGRTIYSMNSVAESDRCEIVWSPGVEIATGVYFYRLTINDNRVDGKLMLLK